MIDFLGTDLDSLDMNFAQALVEIQDILLDDYDYLETPVACFPTDFHWGYYMELDKDRTHRLIRQWPGVVEAPLKTLLVPIPHRNLRLNTEAPTTPRSSAWW